MADLKPTAPPTFKFSEQLWNEKLAKLAKLKDDFAGKPGHNPFTWWATTVSPLLGKFNLGDRSKELYNSFMSIKEEVPPLK